MATPNDPTRLSVGPFTAAQRQRLEALTAAKMLVKGRTTRYQDPWRVVEDPALLSDLLEVADYIATGNLP